MEGCNAGLGGVLSQIQNNVERIVAYCSRALRPSQRKYCTTKREMLAVVSMCIQFRSYLRGAKFTLRTDHKSLVWLHRFKRHGGHDDPVAPHSETVPVFLSYIEQGGSMEMHTDFLGHRQYLADSVLAPIARQWIQQ